MAKRTPPPSEGRPGEKDTEFYYQFRYRAEAPRTYDLASDHEELIEEEAFVVEIEGDIIYAHEPMGEGPMAEPMAVGRVAAQLVRMPDALDAGFRAYDVFDVHSGDLEVVGRTLFFPKSRDRLKPVAEALFEDGELLGHNLLIVHNISLAPEHRGRGVGLVAIYDLMNMFGDPLGAVVTIPASTEGHQDKKAREQARKKLSAHAEHIGFKRIGRGEVWGLSALHKNPTLAQGLARYRKERLRKS